MSSACRSSWRPCGRRSGAPACTTTTSWGSGLSGSSAPVPGPSASSAGPGVASSFSGCQMAWRSPRPGWTTCQSLSPWAPRLGVRVATAGTLMAPRPTTWSPWLPPGTGLRGPAWAPSQRPRASSASCRPWPVVPGRASTNRRRWRAPWILVSASRSCASWPSAAAAASQMRACGRIASSTPASPAAQRLPRTPSPPRSWSRR
mmetsp:Transcript_118780/g.361341  ORF Transcript_118780/g.361341 Transcript_118780/m.361341 type:complete len:203 (-) Transcript_118780:95-703(-)